MCSTQPVARIEQLFQQPHDGVTGVNTGYDDLNKKTAGLQPSDLIIVAARPSMGKTTFADEPRRKRGDVAG
ncbi:replicative DNA helicase [Escherichia coli]|uniref:Replicative DNA helicase n=1 Tax=Escherichia coli TaxID=562 RepID=A0A376XAC2_ECOLX|nr:replicative DNA helicase [Escherichia coli]